MYLNVVLQKPLGSNQILDYFFKTEPN